MKVFLQIATDIGLLVEEKNAAYGASFALAGKFLALLYPAGIQPAQYDDALLLVRIFDKQKRIATDRDALGESPYRDIAGYGVLGAALTDDKRKDLAACNTSARSQTARSSRKVRTDSAAKSTVKNSMQTPSPRSVTPSRTVRSAADIAASSSRNRR